MSKKEVKKVVLAYSGGLDTSIIIPWLKEKGYQLVTVSELIKYKTGKDPVPGKVYWSLY